MPLELRITMIVVSVLVLLYVLAKIRASKMNISDSIFWIVVALLLIVLAVFPPVSVFFSQLIGIQTPFNFVLLVFIAILLLKSFLLSIQLSQQKEKLKKLDQAIAFMEFEQRKREQQEEREQQKVD